VPPLQPGRDLGRQRDANHGRGHHRDVQLEHGQDRERERVALCVDVVDAQRHQRDGERSGEQDRSGALVARRRRVWVSCRGPAQQAGDREAQGQQRQRDAEPAEVGGPFPEHHESAAHDDRGQPRTGQPKAADRDQPKAHHADAAGGDGRQERQGPVSEGERLPKLREGLLVPAKPAEQNKDGDPTANAEAATTARSRSVPMTPVNRRARGRHARTLAAAWLQISRNTHVEDCVSSVIAHP
jgi:hypothetical protein